LIKSGSGILTLTGNNTYNGTTTVNNGTLSIHGNQTAATGDLTIASGGKLGGTGIIGANTTVQNNGGLAFDLSTVPGSHDRLDLAGSLAFAGSSSLTISTTGNNATTGNYTLATAAGGITGSAPATLNLPSGWNATASVSGTDLVLNVTSIAAASPAKVTFTSSGQNAAETAGTAILTVTATGSPTGTITANVTYDSGNSTASLADIGSYTTQTVTLDAGNSYTANVTVTLTDDAAPEGDETAVFELTDLTGSAVLGSPSTHNLTLPANDSFTTWAAFHGVSASLTANDDADKFTNGEEYAFDLDPTVKEYGNVLASTTALSGGNVTMTLAFNGNSAKSDINYVVRRANNPGFTANTVVGHWNGTANWTTSNATYFANETQTGAGAVKAINVSMVISAATEPRQFLKVDIE
jgi:autotransporter-associated beta strand protein